MKRSKNYPTLLLVGLGIIIGVEGFYIISIKKEHKEALERAVIGEQRKAQLMVEEVRRKERDSCQNQLNGKDLYYRVRNQQGIDSVKRVMQMVVDSLEQIIQEDGYQIKTFQKRERIHQDSIRRLTRVISNFQKREKEQIKDRKKGVVKPARPPVSKVGLRQSIANIKVNKQRQYRWKMRFGFSAIGLPICSILYLCGCRLVAPRNRRTRVRGLRPRK